MSDVDRMIDRDGRRLAVRDWGGDGRDIVLFHGGGDNVASWTALGPRLAALGHVVAYDQAGHGRSDDPRPGEEFDPLGDALAVLEATTTAGADGGPILVGHSFGGAVALHLAADGHAGALLLLDGGPSRRHFEPSPAPDPDEARQRLEAMGFGRRCSPAELEEVLASLGPDLAAELRYGHVEVEGGLVERRPTLESALRLGEQGAQPDNPFLDLDLYRRVAVPTIAIYGSEGTSADVRDRVEELLAENPIITSRWIDATHSLNWERPDDVVDAVAELLGSAST